jgi:hypothetical protein
VKSSVRNWVLAKKPLVRSESRVFLDNEHEADIVALKPPNNDFDHGIIFRLFAVGVTYAPRLSKMVGFHPSYPFLFLNVTSNILSAIL